jgi:hypothetical protein
MTLPLTSIAVVTAFPTILTGVVTTAHEEQRRGKKIAKRERILIDRCYGKKLGKE